MTFRALTAGDAQRSMRTPGCAREACSAGGVLNAPLRREEGSCVAKRRRLWANDVGKVYLFYASLCCVFLCLMASAFVAWPHLEPTTQSALRITTAISFVACVVLFVCWECSRKR